MTDRPILMSGAMVRAVLSGAKTQTRRNVFPRSHTPSRGEFTGWVDLGKHGRAAAFRDSIPDDPCPIEVRCPFGAPGDRLWVRETWAPCEAKVRKGHVQYAADGAVGHAVTTNGGERWWERSGHTMGVADAGLQGVWVSKPARWRPSIHMPRWASRLTLEVTDVRVERLAALTEADAKAEGIEAVGGGWRDYLNPGRPLLTWHASFATLWESLNGPGSWNANPWLWVITFRRVETP